MSAEAEAPMSAVFGVPPPLTPRSVGLGMTGSVITRSYSSRYVLTGVYTTSIQTLRLPDVDELPTFLCVSGGPAEWHIHFRVFRKFCDSSEKRL